MDDLVQIEDLFWGWVDSCEDGPDCDEHRSLRAAFKAGWDAALDSSVVIPNRQRED